MILDFEIKGKINTKAEDDALNFLFQALNDYVVKMNVTIYCKNGMVVEKN